MTKIPWSKFRKCGNVDFRTGEKATKSALKYFIVVDKPPGYFPQGFQETNASVYNY